MKNIILTIMDKQGSFVYDIEVPAGQPGGTLTEDVLEVLNDVNPNLSLYSGCHCLYLNRQRRPLTDQETLAGAGVRNGDYITVISRVQED